MSHILLNKFKINSELFSKNEPGSEIIEGSSSSNKLV